MSTESMQSTVSVEPRRQLSNQRALEIMTDAACLLGEFFACARRAVQQVEPALLAKVLKEEPAETPLDPEPTRRPRGRTHPLMALFQMAIKGSQVMTRLAAWTNPELMPGPDSGGRGMEAAARSAQGMMEGLEKMMAGMNLPSAS